MKHMHGKILERNRDGALLISLIVLITVFAGLGAGIVGLVASSTHTRLLANNAQRAYYLAESGGRYAVSRFKADRTVVSGTFQMLDSCGGFSIDTATNGNVLVFTSTGILNPGSGIETRHRITFRVNLTSGSDTLDIGFDRDGDMRLDDEWNVDAGSVSIVQTGPSDGEPALLMRGEHVLISMNWQGNPALNILNAWLHENRTLGYGVQVKIKARSPGASQGNHYMFGISFRLNTVTQTSYGISFFRSIASNKQLPAWVSSLSGFNPLRDGTPYLVLWKQSGGTITLMRYRQLTPADNVLTWDSGGFWTLTPWATLYLDLNEDFTGIGNTRMNHISGFVQGPTIYLRDAPVSWDFADFVPVAWVGATQPINDATYTSANFDTVQPNEIGVHAYYDQPSSQQQFFDDFALRVDGFGASSGGYSGSHVQY
ncbi:MAG: hypothetical protein FJ224_07120 [Lentisphaerae bacterium]|nr:hypothetical protein [Lentisphaerota bacterium]